MSPDTSVISEALRLALAMMVTMPDAALLRPTAVLTSKPSVTTQTLQWTPCTDIPTRTSGMKDDNGSRDGEGSVNPGSNLFVTGIHPKLTESEVSRLFEKYGEVEKAQIMRDPHTKESRGFGFVKMVTSDQADAAKDGLQGEVIEGRTLSIEKARRARPRTPTPRARRPPVPAPPTRPARPAGRPTAPGCR